MRIQSAQQKYLNDVFGLNDPELLKIREELHKHNLDFMSISGHEARMLQFLVRVSGAKKIVEIGTLFGFSAAAVAKVLPKDGQIWTLEKNPTNAEIARAQFQRSPELKIKLLEGDALESLRTLESEGPFDLVFIDADKSGYPEYLTWAEKHVRQGGYIVGDNSFLWGAVFDEPFEDNISAKQVSAMKEFNLRLSDRSKFNSTLIPTVEGMTIAQKL